MSTEDDLTGLLAERVAAYVDELAKAGDGAAMVRAIKDLRELMDQLPIRGEEAPGDGGSPRGRIVSLFDGPPTLGDTADV